MEFIIGIVAVIVALIVSLQVVGWIKQGLQGSESFDEFDDEVTWAGLSKCEGKRRLARDSRGRFVRC